MAEQKMYFVSGSIENKALFDIDKTLLKELFERKKYPYEVLSEIKEEILKLCESLSLEEYDNPREKIFIHKTAKVFSSAYITSPCIICENAEIRQGAFLRGSVLVGKNAVVGNSTELKNVILFDNAQVPHFNYVGDSILGYKAHMGAGAITSNVKSDKRNVVIHGASFSVVTNMKKVGAFLGDFVEIGCNSVLCPGCIIGRNTTVYPLSRVRGIVNENSIYKSEEDIAQKKFMP